LLAQDPDAEEEAQRVAPGLESGPATSAG
jgi:hypothetical protein